MMKKSIKDFDLDNKKVIIRVDFNVPIKNGNITDDNRIKESLKTIQYAIDNNAKVILMSHLGRVKEEQDLEKNTLEPVALRLSELLDKDIVFVDMTRGKELEDAINEMKPKDVLLIQNTRYEDLDGKKESKNDPELGAYWASLGDIYINDAFGTAHRAHASNVGIASHLPNGIGFLIEKELENLLPAINEPDRPLTVILGGSKVSDKIGVIENLVKIADHILIGGGMAFTFLKASGLPIGKSLLDEENIEFCKKILKEHEDKIVLPIDVVCSKSIEKPTDVRECFISDIKDDEIGLDIGNQSVKLFKQHINDSKTIIWNGPVGMFEEKAYENGTKEICKALTESGAKTIVGGGDSASAAINFGYKDKFSHISTGGGASLELLEGKVLPGIDIINEK
ncbi:MAG: phosphoglycerate kinase [Bacilli bacterium]|nr:phosphoglycerate kinase [Bacilli bacterium]